MKIFIIEDSPVSKDLLRKLCKARPNEIIPLSKDQMLACTNMRVLDFDKEDKFKEGFFDPNSIVNKEFCEELFGSSSKRTTGKLY